MSMQPAGLEQVVARCAWCGHDINPHMRVTIAGGRFTDWSPQIETLRGHVVSVQTWHEGRVVKAIVPLPDTPANHAGYDLMFVLCGIECRDALARAIGGAPMMVRIADGRQRQRVRRARSAQVPRANGPARRPFLRRRRS